MKIEKNPPQVFTSLGQAGTYMKVSRQAVYLAIQKGLLKAVKKCNKWEITLEDITAYMENKFNRDLRKDKEGQFVFDMDAGHYSVKQARTILSDNLGYFPLQRLYYLLRSGQIKSMRKGAAWIIPVGEIERLIMEGDQYKVRGVS